MDEYGGDIATTAATLFNAIKHTDMRGNEYWLARELAEVLSYSEWRNFEKVIEKVKVSVINGGESVENHFVDVNKMVTLPKTKLRMPRAILPSKHDAKN